MQRATIGTLKDFCECGAILPIPKSNDLRKGFVNCGICQKPAKCIEVLTHKRWSKYLQVDMEVISRWETRYDSDRIQTTAMGNEEVEKSEESPAVERICAKCGHNRMRYATRQTRSADEGMTVFFTCVDCGFKDIEYS